MLTKAHTLAVAWYAAVIMEGHGPACVQVPASYVSSLEPRQCTTAIHHT